MKTDWSETLEQGVSTADFNRIEQTTKNIKTVETGNAYMLSGWRPNIPTTNRIEQPFFISVPAGYRLILEYVNYAGYGGGVALAVADFVTDASYTMDDDSIFNSFKDDEHKAANHKILNQVLLENAGDSAVNYELGVYDVFAQSEATYNRSWELRFIIEVIPDA